MQPRLSRASDAPRGGYRMPLRTPIFPTSFLSCAIWETPPQSDSAERTTTSVRMDVGPFARWCPPGGRYRPGQRTTAFAVRRRGSIGQTVGNDTSWGVEDGHQDELQAAARSTARARLVRIVPASVRVRARTKLDLGAGQRRRHRPRRREGAAPDDGLRGLPEADAPSEEAPAADAPAEEAPAEAPPAEEAPAAPATDSSDGSSGGGLHRRTDPGARGTRARSGTLPSPVTR